MYGYGAYAGYAYADPGQSKYWPLPGIGTVVIGWLDADIKVRPLLEMAMTATAALGIERIGAGAALVGTVEVSRGDR